MGAPAAIGHDRRGRGSVYAITFDTDAARVEELYDGPSWKNGHAAIGKVLRDHGFDWQQGSVCFGDDTVNAVTCVLEIQDVSKEVNWFGPSVRDVRMLRIEELDDLGPALEGVARL